MDTPLDAYQLLFRFPLNRVGTTEDVAEFSLWMAGVGGAEYGDSQLHSAAIGAVTAWQDHMDQGNFCSNVSFGSVVATNFLANGHVNHQQEVVADGGWVGNDTHSAMPWETSLAVSLYTYPRGTFVSQGRRKRGRYYMPPMSANVLDSSNSGYFSDAHLADLLTSVKAFLGAAQEDMVGADVGVLSVYSRADGVLRPVSQVTLDAKFDSQRRRENRENAGFIQTAFP